MEALVTIAIVIIVIGAIYVRLLSWRAQKHRYFVARIPEGRNIQQVVDDVYSTLPQGWVPAGSKKAHLAGLYEWIQADGGGNLLNIVTGTSVTGYLVLSVELGITQEDEFGRPVGIPFDEAPPQSEYDAHVWVSFARGGVGTVWSPFKSMAVERAKSYLVEKLS